MIERMVKINRYKPYAERYDIFKDTYSMIEVFKFLKLQPQLLEALQSIFRTTGEEINASNIKKILDGIGDGHELKKSKDRIARAIDRYSNNLYREHFYNIAVQLNKWEKMPINKTWHTVRTTEKEQ